MAGLLLKTLHTLGKLDLIISNLMNVLVAPLDVCTVTPQTSIVSIELLLDNIILFPQAVNQCLVVVDKELDVLPVLANLLCKMITLKMLSC